MIEEVEKKIDEYVEHRMKREREIVAVLKEAGEMTSMDITNKVYAVCYFMFMKRQIREI